MSDKSDDEKRREFHLEEYKKLRTEDLELTKKYDRIKFVLLLGSGAIYYWILTKIGVTDGDLCLTTFSIVAYGAAILPVIGSIFAGILGVEFFNHFVSMGVYMRMLEIKLGETELGWQKFRFNRQIEKVDHFNRDLNENSSVDTVHKDYIKLDPWSVLSSTLRDLLYYFKQIHRFYDLYWRVFLWLTCLISFVLVLVVAKASQSYCGQQSLLDANREVAGLDVNVLIAPAASIAAPNTQPNRKNVLTSA